MNVGTSVGMADGNSVGVAVGDTVGTADGGLDTGGCSVVVVAIMTTVPVKTW